MRYLRPLFLIAALLVAPAVEAKRHKKAKPHRAARVTHALAKKAQPPQLTPLERAVLAKPISDALPVAAVTQENDDETPGARRKK